jgi:SAM-dependent methyltransferase
MIRTAASAARHPLRATRALLTPEGRRRVTFNLRGEDWRSVAPGVTQRQYGSYEQYVAHQRSKLAQLDLTGYEERYETALTERLGSFAGRSVLCLGARLGAEVRAFRNVGAFAIGVDLNPGKDNRYVLPGDFHALDFPDACVDVVFTNSLDHAFDLPRLAKECGRVTKPGGLAVLEVVAGQDEGGSFRSYEATSWSSVSQVVQAFASAGGFSEVRQCPFEVPWAGLHVRLERTPGSPPDLPTGLPTG